MGIYVGDDKYNEQKSKLDLINRQDVVNALGEEPLVWHDGDDEIAERNQWRRDRAAIEVLPSVEPKMGEMDIQSRRCNRINVHEAKVF